MKPTTPIIALFVVLLAAILWLGFLAQKETPETQYVEPQKTESPTVYETDEVPLPEKESENNEFGNDTKMEYPIPDSDEPLESGLESAPIEVLEEVYGEDYSGPSTGKSYSDFSLSGKSFDFLMNGEEAPTLRVNAGDTVFVTLKSIEGMHDFVIDELNVQSEKVSFGEVTTVEFGADRPGVYEYYCSVGSHRAQGMFGAFIVE